MFLHPVVFGRVVIRSYYVVSPVIARAIQRSRLMRQVAKAMLKPIMGWRVGSFEHAPTLFSDDALISIVALIVVLALSSGRRRSNRIADSIWRPRKPRDAKLVYAEKLFTT